MALIKLNRHYKGKLCEICNIPITTGSKTGYCKFHFFRKPFSAEHIKHLSDSKRGILNHRFGLKLSNEIRLKISKKLSGENSYNWKGGITEKNKAIRRSVRYRIWRENIFKRDNYTCVFCGKIGGKLNADHIKSFSKYPKLRFDLENGRTLCEKCHRTTDNFAFKAIKYAAS